MTATNAPNPSKNRTPLVWKGEPVATTEQLAAFYGVPMKRLKSNHLNNRSRFAETKHCITLTGDRLRGFKRDTQTLGLVKPSVNSVTLWTRRGAARHAKMLNSDKAWDVFEMLEDSYFAPAAPAPAPSTPVQIGEGENLLAAFQAECVILQPGAILSPAALHAGVAAWRAVTAHPPLDMDALAVCLGNRGTRMERGEGWRGLALTGKAVRAITTVATWSANADDLRGIWNAGEAARGRRRAVTSVDWSGCTPLPATRPAQGGPDLPALLRRASHLRGARTVFPDTAPRVAAEMDAIERTLKTHATAELRELDYRVRIAVEVLGLDADTGARLDRMVQGRAVT